MYTQFVLYDELHRVTRKCKVVLDLRDEVKLLLLYPFSGTFKKDLEMKTFKIIANAEFRAEDLDDAFVKLSNYFAKLTNEDSEIFDSLFSGGKIEIGLSYETSSN